MNRIDKLFGLQGEAAVKFLDGEFEIIRSGDFVRCAVTGQPIKLADLRYWSVDRQEAYASAEIAMKRHLEFKQASPPRSEPAA